MVSFWEIYICSYGHQFVGSDTDFCTPEEKLNIILKHSPMQASAFLELNCLYTQILSV